MLLQACEPHFMSEETEAEVDNSMFLRCNGYNTSTIATLPVNHLSLPSASEEDGNLNHEAPRAASWKNDLPCINLNFVQNSKKLYPNVAGFVSCFRPKLEVWFRKSERHLSSPEMGPKPLCCRRLQWPSASDIWILKIIQPWSNNGTTAEAGCLQGGTLDKGNSGFFPPYSLIAQKSGVIISCCVSECLGKASEVREWAALEYKILFSYSCSIY